MTRKTQVKETKTSAKSEQKGSKSGKTDRSKTDSQEDYNILFSGTAKKLSPKSDGLIGYELIKDTKNEHYIRLTENASGGIFCKNPVPLKSIVSVLDKQIPDKPFKSSIMKDVFVGKGSKSANNTSFLIAVLRTPDIALIVSTKNSQFLSTLSPEFKAKANQLLSK